MKEDKAIRKAFDLLGIETYPDIDYLIGLLKERRNMFHPDKFDETVKKEVGEKFVYANNLIEELEAIKGSGSQEISIKESIENSILLHARSMISSQINDIQMLRQENDLLRKNIQDLESRNKAFETASEHERKARIKQEIIDIEKTYEVSRNEILGATAAVVLTATMAMLTAFGEIAGLLQEAAPPLFAETINLILVLVSLLLVLMAMKKMIRDHEFRSMLKEISNISFIKELDRSEKLSGTFSETRLIGCIERHFKNLTYKRLIPNKFKWIIKFFPIKLFYPYPIRTFIRKKLGLLELRAINLLKDALILYMLDRKLIEHESTYQLDRIYEAIDWDR